MATSANIRPPLKHTAFDERPLNDTPYVSNEWYDWALNIRKAIDTLRIIVGDPDGDGVVTDVKNLLEADVTVFARDMLPIATGGCSALTTVELAVGEPNYHVLLFDPTTQEAADFHVMLPFSWVGRKFKIYVYWAHASGGTDWDVVWEVTAISTGDNESLIQTFPGGAVIYDTGGTGGNLYIAALSEAVPVVQTLNRDGNLLSMRVMRLAGHASDTMDIDAGLIAVRFTLTDLKFPPPPDPGTTDPDFSMVVLLLHGNGANGGTIIDSSLSNHTATVTGTPAVEISFPKWGTGAILFDATSGYISEGASSDWNFGSGDFTIEFWLGHFDWSGVALETPIIALWSANGGQGFSWVVSVNINNRLQFGRYIGGVASFAAVSTNAMTGIGTSYRHCAIAREGTTLRMFFDGVQEYSGAITGAIDYTSGTHLTIGGTNYSGNQYLNGYLDDVRITKGLARYTAAFTPPTAQFPDG
jgi:hypothetical protein